MRRSDDVGHGFGMMGMGPGELRVFGALIIGISLAILGLLSVFFPVFPDQALAAIVTICLGGFSIAMAFGMGLLVFSFAPWTAVETQYILGIIIAGTAGCIVVEWLVAWASIVWGVVLGTPFLTFSSVGVIGWVLTVVVAPFEEMVCAFFQGLFTRIAGPVPGILGRAGIFGIFHFRVYGLGVGFWAMLGVGAIIGTCYYLVPTFEVPMSIHMLLNFAAVMPLCWALGGMLL